MIRRKEAFTLVVIYCQTEWVKEAHTQISLINTWKQCWKETEHKAWSCDVVR